METKIKNLLARLAFFAEDGMAEPPIVAIAKDADALLKEMCIASAVEQAKLNLKDAVTIVPALHSDGLPVHAYANAVIKDCIITKGACSGVVFPAEQAQQAEPVARDELSQGFYWLSKKDGTHKCLVRVYECEGFLGVGFGVWDGGAYMPMPDVTEDSVFVPLYAQPPAVAVPSEQQRENWQLLVSMYETGRGAQKRGAAGLAIGELKRLLAAAQKGGA